MFVIINALMFTVERGRMMPGDMQAWGGEGANRPNIIGRQQTQLLDKTTLIILLISVISIISGIVMLLMWNILNISNKRQFSSLAGFRKEVK